MGRPILIVSREELESLALTLACKIVTITTTNPEMGCSLSFFFENTSFHKVVYNSIMDNISAPNGLGYNTLMQKEQLISSLRVFGYVGEITLMALK